jgi:hypothetical protein
MARQEFAPPDGPEIPAIKEQESHVQSYRAGLSLNQRTRHDRRRLIETDQTPAVVIVRWPIKPSVFHPPLPGAADSAARVFAAAAVRLAAIKRERRL